MQPHLSLAIVSREEQDLPLQTWIVALRGGLAVPFLIPIPCVFNMGREESVGAAPRSQIAGYIAHPNRTHLFIVSIAVYFRIP